MRAIIPVAVTNAHGAPEGAPGRCVHSARCRAFFPASKRSYPKNLSDDICQFGLTCRIMMFYKDENTVQYSYHKQILPFSSSLQGSQLYAVAKILLNGKQEQLCLAQHLVQKGK